MPIPLLEFIVLLQNKRECWKHKTTKSTKKRRNTGYWHTFNINKQEKGKIITFYYAPFEVVTFFLSY